MIAIILPGMGIGALLLVWAILALSDAIDIWSSRPRQPRPACAVVVNDGAWSGSDSAMVVVLVIAGVAGLIHLARAIS